MVRKRPEGLPSVACNSPFGADALGAEFYNPSDPSGMEAQSSIASESAEIDEARDCRTRQCRCAFACPSSSNQACSRSRVSRTFVAAVESGWRLPAILAAARGRNGSHSEPDRYGRPAAFCSGCEPYGC